MIVRITECEGGYKVALVTADGERESRVVSSVAEAFDLQAGITIDGFASDPVAEPEVRAAQAKKGKKK